MRVASGEPWNGAGAPNDCENTGPIQGHSYIGSIAGTLQNNCTGRNLRNSGSVTGNNMGIGGVVGAYMRLDPDYSPCTLTNTWYTGSTEYGIGSQGDVEDLSGANSTNAESRTEAQLKGMAFQLGGLFAPRFHRNQRRLPRLEPAAQLTG